ncbi:MAG: ribosomal RNA small subunit methyltransferase A [Candidatus Koribacter versatilis]|uniref:Ribosomal RNA small subunit methyltransferase A n=1 Tax=Candidatus Korobacter versatilis TaxID=658062 RepID=A0A932A879_9BACT|nr:ribosomal RNA small subunit methyltransferase A [Candidatus Koribacter versatilis]
MPTRVNVTAGGKRGSKPRMGQNFLADRKAAERIVAALGDVTNKLVVEIGPGKGVLTDMLVQRAAHVVAIELDRVLGAQLRMKYSGRSNLEIIEGDVLGIDFARLVGRDTGTAGDTRIHRAPKAQVIGNLPYYITSPILMHLFAHQEHIEQIVIMVQREVAERIAAEPGGRKYGVLSATAQLFAKVENLFTLPPGAFTPPPKVHSTVLRLTIEPKAEKLGVAPGAFLEFLKLAFAQKRKTLLNNVKQRYPEQAARAIAAAKLRPDVRAEAVGLEKMAKVFRALAP